MKARGKKGKEKRRARSEKAPPDLAAIPAGARIAAIDVVKKDPNLRRIVVAETTVATLPDSVVDKLALAVGTRWTPELAAKIETAVDAAKARKTAMKLLSRRGLARDEV